MPLTTSQVKTIKKTIKVGQDRLPVIFNAVSDPTRCRIFRLLMVTHGDDVKVSDIAHIMGMTLPAISQQLKVLEQSGLISREKIGQIVYYKIKNNDPLVISIVKIIQEEQKR
ncbi:MAG: winged helix-turn-helix transcriptional regulator [Patescibacteria group bacterium]|nr:winged helix-turn-helix transcriptional regulator [Patescibacteria group bacterium]